MNEEQWLSCVDPKPMLEFLRGKASDRKLRLFACACCRTVWQWLTDERSRNGVKAAELYADKSEFLAECRAASENSLRAMEDASGDSESAELGHTKWHAATAVACCTEIPFRRDSAHDASQEARQAESCYLFESTEEGVAVPYPEPEASDGSAHAALLKDIFGNPFRPCSIPSSWLAWNDWTVKKVAEAIYQERAFEQIPLLADALEDAGCTNKDILAHCREQGAVHVRGCWVIDLLLGKS